MKLSIEVLLFVALLLFQCHPIKDKKPPLDQETVSAILIELYVIEEKVRRMGISQDSVYKVLLPIKREIYGKFQTTDSVFNASVNFYRNNPEEWQQIYAAVVDSLSVTEQKSRLNSR